MSVLTVPDTREYLNIPTTTSDTELQKFIDRAEAAVGKKCGPLASTSVTRQVDGGGSSLVLPVTPVISLTSVTANDGTVVSPSDLTVLSPGVVRYTAGGACFPACWYTVVYSAGRATPPTDLLLGVMELIRHLWATQRGSGRSGPAGDTAGGPGYLMPYRVLELIGPYEQPGFA